MSHVRSPSKHPRALAIELTRQADNLRLDSDPIVTAKELGLRRDAHLALCRTEEFKNYRESARKRGSRDFRVEWKVPSGELVCRLLMPKRRA